MPQPQAFERQTDFTERDGDDTDHPALNQELDAVALSIDGIRDNLALIQRDDGALKNGIVTLETVAPNAFDSIFDETIGEAQAAAAAAQISAVNADAARDAAASNATDAAGNAILAVSRASSAANSVVQATIQAGIAENFATLAGNAQTAAAASAVEASDSAAAAAAAGHSTGDFKDTLATTAPAGWVFASGGLLGNAGAVGATLERADADTQALYTLLWNNLSNTEAPVVGGRGANAESDFAALKAITLPDLRGRVRAGRDAMGAVGAANRMTAGGSGLAGATLGAVGGTQTHTLTAAQIPAHDHSYNTLVNVEAGVGSAQSVLRGDMAADRALNTNMSTGGGAAHNNTQPTFITNVLIKL